MKDRPTFYGPWFRFARGVARHIMGRYEIVHPERFCSPAIYVSRHQNMHGPIHVMAYAPEPLHLWALHLFTRFRTCFRQFRDYTLSVRLGWPKPLAAIVAALIALPISQGMKSCRAIPVYRGLREVVHTLNLSAELLAKGESIVVFPDIGYTDETFTAGSMYTGYLHVIPKVRKLTGKTVPIIPLYCPYGSRKLVCGEPIWFSEDVPFRLEQERVNNEIRSSLDALTREYEG